jgi:hypothetical protein
MKRLGLLGLLVTATFPAGAGAVAHARITDSDPVTEAVERAVEYWGATPCGAQVAIVSGMRSEAPSAGINSDGSPGEVAAMWSTWLTPAGANLFADPPASFSDCTVHINSSVWPNWRADDANFPEFCKEMGHEYGHLEGYPDAGAAPGTGEYEQPALARVRLCERYRLVYGHEIYTPRSVHRVARKRRRAMPLDLVFTATKLKSALLRAG